MVDENVGKLAKLLRLLGYDTVYFTGENDTQMVNMALAEKRIILTRDTHIFERRLIISGKVKALPVKSDKVDEQIQQVFQELNLHPRIQPFTVCLECNRQLIPRTKDEIRERVPPYVFQTQKEYVECPQCHRLYWKGTHWEAMTRSLKKLIQGSQEAKK
jgi:uncharacterized protein with PIN domain